MPGDFPFFIWNMAVFNSVRVICLINFSISSSLILGESGSNSVVCIFVFVYVLVYSVEKNASQCFRISKSFVVVVVVLYCVFFVAVLLFFVYVFAFFNQKIICLVFLV